MKAIQVERAGGPETLRPVSLPDLVPGPGEVVLTVDAVGVNFSDVKVRRGDYPPPASFPFVPGWEAAGHILHYGDDTHHLGQEQRYAAYMPALGAYAEQILVRADHLFPLPGDFSEPEGGAWLSNYLVAWLALTDRGRLESGDYILVHAAAGGVGTAACQMAEIVGARVLGLVGSAGKEKVLHDLGVERVVNYRTQDVESAVLTFTEGHGLDIVLDSVGGQAFDRALRMMAPFGRIVVLGNAAGEAALSPSSLIDRNVAVVGFNLSGYSIQAFGEAMTHVRRMHLEANLRPVVGATFALADAAKAHALLESGKSVGKVVLLP